MNFQAKTKAVLADTAATTGREFAADRSAAERRTTPRVPMAVDVEISLGKQTYRGLRTRDVGFDGVFIEAQPTDFALNGRVEVSLDVPVGAGVKTCRFGARIARLVPEGAAVAFDRGDLDAYAALLHLVCTHAPSRQSFEVDRVAAV